MHPIKKSAHLAGFLYLLLVIIGPIRLMYIPNKLIVDDAATTAANINAHLLLFRIGIYADTIGSVVLILLALALYRLFENVDRNLAWLLVILGAFMVAPIYIMNTAIDATALALAQGEKYFSAFSQPQREALARLFLNFHYHVIVADEIYWGLWLLPFGALVYKSRFLPRILGAWLILNGVAYVAVSFAGVFYPQYAGKLFDQLFPVMFAEIAIMLWLLIRGANVRRMATSAA